ncbi:MAG: organic solvent tolerance protein [Bdellovibrionaceae bacterium]|nr:organic solvent tolerance protein [Pseudobdellovibrionaceae bacterium]
MRNFVKILTGVLILSEIAMAKDLASRLGVGVKNNSSEDVPAVSVVYYPNHDFGITGGIGIDTKKDQSKFVVNGGVRKVLFKENQLNFYFGGQLGLVNYEGGGEKQNGFELNAIFGAEFFFTGLDSLGFSFEGGAGISSLKDVRFRTVADSPVRAGITFYF